MRRPYLGDSMPAVEEGRQADHKVIAEEGSQADHKRLEGTGAVRKRVGHKRVDRRRVDRKATAPGIGEERWRSSLCLALPL